jgi:hypothetical protein
MTERDRATPERSRPLPKTHDYRYPFRYPFRGTWDKASHGLCRVRFFERAAETSVIVCTELPDNPSTSVTNMAEILAAELIARHFPQRFDDAARVACLELYPARHDR